MSQNQRSENLNDFKYLRLDEILDKIDFGIKYCDNIYSKTNKCTRIGTKYECEICEVPEEEQKQICKAWKRVIYLSKLFYIGQIISLIDRYGDMKEAELLFIKREDLTKPKKEKTMLPNSQMGLFGSVRLQWKK